MAKCGGDFMKEYKLSLGYYIFIAIFGIFGALAVVLGFSMITDSNTAAAEDEGPLAWIFIVVGTVWVISAMTMILQIFFYKKSGLKLSKEGISDTLVFMNILAFYFVMPVKFIPWDAINSISEEKGVLVAVVDTSKVDASGMAKLLLKLCGYQFCAMFVKPRVTREDINEYRSA